MNKKDFAQKLRQYRFEQRLSISDLSDKSGMSDNYIRHLEAGLSCPTLRTVLKLADALQINPKSLVEEAETPQKPLHLNKSMHYDVLSLSKHELHVLKVAVEAISKQLETKNDIGIGKRIQYYRQMRGLSQLQLSKMIGKSSVYVGKIEVGMSNISIETLKKIADVLKVDFDFLVCDISKEAEALTLENILQTSEDKLSAEDFEYLKNIYFYIIHGFEHTV